MFTMWEHVAAMWEHQQRFWNQNEKLVVCLQGILAAAVPKLETVLDLIQHQNSVCWASKQFFLLCLQGIVPALTCFQGADNSR